MLVSYLGSVLFRFLLFGIGVTGEAVSGARDRKSVIPIFVGFGCYYD